MLRKYDVDAVDNVVISVQFTSSRYGGAGGIPITEVPVVHEVSRIPLVRDDGKYIDPTGLRRLEVSKRFSGEARNTSIEALTYPVDLLFH